tara:strand:+ start:288 stop:566 length:279 start_codon:yes stop_codon:yes gene_type:complete
MQKVVHGYVNQPGVRAIKKTLNQADAEAAPTVRFEPRQDLLEKRRHMNARGRYQAIHDTKHKRKRGKDSQRPCNDFNIQHFVASFIKKTDTQ